MGRHHHRGQRGPDERAGAAGRRQDLGVRPERDAQKAQTGEKPVVLLLLAVAFFYAFYCGAGAIWSYLELSSVVDRALEESGRAGAAAVREAILQSAGRAGVRVHAQNVLVSEEGGIYSIHIRWTWPVITYRGENVLEIPLSLQRSVRRL